MKLRALPKFWDRISNDHGDLHTTSFRIAVSIEGKRDRSEPFSTARSVAATLTSLALLFIGVNRIGITHADTLPVVHVSGTLTADTTWTPDNIYIVDHQLTIPDGYALTVGAGTIVKYSTGFDPIQVNTGGTLNATGTTASPVTFTSLNDDSVGGDTAGDGSTTGTPGEYSSAIAMNGGTVSVSHANFAYAGTSVVDTGGSTAQLSVADSTFTHNVSIGGVSGGQANFSDVSMTNATNGLSVTGHAQVTFRGSFSSITNKAITVCDWGQNCSVDAAYTDWGSVNGPFASDPNNNMTCGAISVSPWKYGSSTYNSSTSPFGLQNCDGSTTPDQQLDSSISNYQTHVSSKQIDCNNGFQDACDAINTAFQCLTGAVNTAASTSPIPVPTISTAGDISSFSATMKSSTKTYIAEKTTETVVGNSPAVGGLFDVFNIFSSLSDAYTRCAP